MAVINAFRAIRPKKEITERFAALPYDVYDRREATQEVKREPLSFLKIDRAETVMDESIDTYDPRVYQRAHDQLWAMVKSGDLIQDAQESFYIYELTMNGRSQTGLVACASVDDYLSGVIKKHENTRESKEKDRIRHVDVCNAQTGPIFLAYRKNDTIKQCLNIIKQNQPIFDFISPDGIRHRGWSTNDPDMIKLIAGTFQKISQIYIADGHHRAASAVKVSQMRRKAAHNPKGEMHAYDSFLSVLFSEEELLIMDYNRIVHDLNGYSEEEFLKQIKECADVTMISECSGYHPCQKGEAGMYLNHKWYVVRFHCDKIPDPVESLDVSILQNQILNPILGILDPKTDERISFVGGIRGLSELVSTVDKCGGVAFSMYPTSMDELFNVADAGKLMPPKSTWFEPKLRSGLFIHSLKDD